MARSWNSSRGGVGFFLPRSWAACAGNSPAAAGYRLSARAAAAPGPGGCGGDSRGRGGTAGRLLGGQVLVGGDDDPGFEPLGAVAAEREIFPFLQQAQQLDLGGDGEIADFVQEKGPVGRLLDHAAPRLVGAGKGPAQVAEQGVGEDRVVKTGHIDRDQLAASSRSGCARHGRPAPCRRRSHR